MDWNAAGAIETCFSQRERAAATIRDVIAGWRSLSETGYRQEIAARFNETGSSFDKGWYSPPPGGISLLFGNEGNYGRLLYDSLRRQEFWPRDDIALTPESVAMFYVSPFDRRSAVIGDFGLTLYRGKKAAVVSHLKRCLAVIEKVVDFPEVGMEFRQVFFYGQKLFTDSGLTNQRTAALTNPVGTQGLGHTVPWTDRPPTADERMVIESEDYESSRKLLSMMRRYISAGEKYTIPNDCAFTVEVRLEDSADSSLPNIFFHYIVAFNGGRKRIHAGFNPIFRAAEMDETVMSRFG